MTNKEKITYMGIAAALCHFHIQERELDLLVSLYELVNKTKGDATLEDVAKVKVLVEKRHPAKPLEGGKSKSK